MKFQELQSLEGVVNRMKSSNSEKLQSEYDKLVEGLKRTERERANDERLANPVLPDQVKLPELLKLQKTDF